MWSVEQVARTELSCQSKSNTGAGKWGGGEGGREREGEGEGGGEGRGEGREREGEGGREEVERGSEHRFNYGEDTLHLNAGGVSSNIK